jgi:hypothetical protein
MIILSILAGLIMPWLSFASSQDSSSISPPGTLEELKAAGQRALNALPDFFKGIWQGFLGFCSKVWNFFKNIWDSYIFPFLDNLWHKTIGKEIEKRKPVIKEEFQKEKEEAKEEIKANLPTAKSLWERFKELIK